MNLDLNQNTQEFVKNSHKEWVEIDKQWEKQKKEDEIFFGKVYIKYFQDREMRQLIKEIING